MIRFECDYAEGGHPAILQKLLNTNMEQTGRYGLDVYCESARQKIQRVCQAPDAAVHFLVGGTQTNKTVIDCILRPHQGVLAAATGHINTHETGAIEATGHKVMVIPDENGKLTAQQVEAAYHAHWNDENHEHITQPGMVYISFPTENGTMYTKTELEELSAVCKKLGLPLYLDGARMGYGLAAPGNDVTLPDIAGLCDVFYIGGTKVGALFGEAVVITNPAFQKDFRYHMKQNGGMLAKGRLLGLQFDVLFEDDLYMNISHHAIEMAMMLKEGFQRNGFSFLYDSITNQQFPILSCKQIQELEKNYGFEHWAKVDEEHNAVRFCTSWATRQEDVETLLRDIGKLI